MSDYGEVSEPTAADLEKTPNEIIVVPFEWASKLKGNTISGSATYSLPDGLTNEDTNESGSYTDVEVSGGSDGYTYRVTAQITDSAGLVHELTKRVIVREG